jgi:hypothetical protein
MPRKMARQTLERHAGACYAESRPYLGSGLLGSPENRYNLPHFRVHPGNPGLRLGKVAAGIAGLCVVLIELAVSLPKHTLPPDEVLPTLGQPVVNTLASYGLTLLELFCGAGLDPTATDCEIRLTPLFTSQDLARQAALA